jgi:DNA-binding SARP family transcriptional activator
VSAVRAATGTQLRLLDSFGLESGGASVDLPMSARRVVAFVAMRDRPVLRSFVACSLWPDTADERAHANLRSALWRLHRFGAEVVESRGQLLALGRDVVVDLRHVERLLRLALEGSTSAELEHFALAGDLLPDWYDDWIVLERERFRQLRLAALDVLYERLVDAGRLRDALDVALAAITVEPLRESAHRAVVRIHLAEGNVVEAVRQYRLCRRLLTEQLGVQPSALMHELMRGVDGSTVVGSPSEVGARR